MKRRMMLGLAAAVLCVGAASALAAEQATETRPIDARVQRVKLEGLANLKIRHGAKAQLVLSGDKALVERTLAEQDGDLLTIGTEGKRRGVYIGRSPRLDVELVLPQLRAVSVESLGSTTVDGFKGESLDVELDGAGSMQVAATYRKVRASLGGLGSLVMQKVDSDEMELNLGGAGHVTVSGRSRNMKVELGGLGGLDARQCEVASLKLNLSGLGNARVRVLQDADLALSGMGSVVVYGKPSNRKVVVDGLGSVSWR